MDKEKYMSSNQMCTIILTFLSNPPPHIKMTFWLQFRVASMHRSEEEDSSSDRVGSGRFSQTISSNLMTPEEISKVGREGVACSGKTAVKHSSTNCKYSVFFI